MPSPDGEEVPTFGSVLAELLIADLPSWTAYFQEFGFGLAGSDLE